MISYELAKKLKDADFPQAKEGIYINDTQDKIIASPEHFGKIPQFAYLPTLSELIEACGEWVKLYGFEDTWGCEGSDKKQFTGSTPEEAVTQLYLSLNV